MNTEFYDSQHQHPLNRAAHFIGIPVIAAGAALAAWPHHVPFKIRRSSALMWCAGGWALLVLGHAIEGNRPAVLKRPAMLWHALYWWFDRARSLPATAGKRIADRRTPAASIYSSFYSDLRDDEPAPRESRKT